VNSEQFLLNFHLFHDLLLHFFALKIGARRPAGDGCDSAAAERVGQEAAFRADFLDGGLVFALGLFLPTAAEQSGSARIGSEL
jgi:hypothetical protein